MDAVHEELERIYAGKPKGMPEVICFTPELLRMMPAKNRAMYKYVWLRHVQEYEEFMRQHPELDQVNQWWWPQPWALVAAPGSTASGSRPESPGKPAASRRLR